MRVDTVMIFVSGVRILGKVTVDRDAIASRTAVQVILKIHAISLTVDLLEQLLASMHDEPCKRYTVPAVKTDFSSDGFEWHEMCLYDA